MIKLQKMEIYSILQSRLATHDRRELIAPGKYFYYLPRLYNNIFDGLDKDFSNELIYLQIQSLNIYFRNEYNEIKSIPFYGIDHLVYDNTSGRMYVEIQNKRLVALTPKSKNHIITNNYEDFIIEGSFSRATIDHNPAFKNCIIENIHKLELLDSISRKIGNRKIKEINSAYRNILKQEMENDKDRLWDELVLLTNILKTDLVHKKYNKSHER